MATLSRRLGVVCVSQASNDPDAVAAGGTLRSLRLTDMTEGESGSRPVDSKALQKKQVPPPSHR